MRTLCDIQPGQTVGRYEFLLPIAQGGYIDIELNGSTHRIGSSYWEIW